MIETDQTEIGVDNPRANCLPACLASILEANIEDFNELYEPDWWGGTAKVLKKFNMAPIYYHVGGEPNFPAIAPKGYHVALGVSPRSKDHLHAVVAFNGKVVFDPHPTRGGLVGDISAWIILVPRATSG